MSASLDYILDLMICSAHLRYKLVCKDQRVVMHVDASWQYQDIRQQLVTSHTLLLYECTDSSVLCKCSDSSVLYGCSGTLDLYGCSDSSSLGQLLSHQTVL